MYLKKRPTYFVKGTQRKTVFHTVEARELLAQGWAEEGKVAPVEEAAPVAPEPEPEPVAEAQPAPDLLDMTKAELVAYAEANDISVRAGATKSEILEACLESEASNG